MKRGPAALIALLSTTPACTLHPEAEFNAWCGDVLCDWKLEEGRIERAPTWHQQDYGARMLDAPVVISREMDVGRDDCTRFSFVGNVDAAAQLALELDVYDEGPIEFVETIPETRWEAQIFFVPPVDLEFVGALTPVPGSLRLHKRGSGNVVLARLEVNSVPCDSTARLPITSIPDGEFCTSADQCRNGVCEPSLVDNVCSGCTVDADCGEGARCESRSKSLGTGIPISYSYRECAPPRPLPATGEPAR